MNITVRLCEYCHKSIEHRKSTATTCGNTCQQYAMQVRKGKREALPFPQDINRTFTEEEKESIHQQIDLLNSEINRLGVEYEELEEKKNSVPYKGGYHLRRKLEELQQRKSGSLSEEELEEISIKEKALIKEYESAVRFNEALTKEVQEIEVHQHRVFLRKFRVKDKRSQLIRNYFFEGGKVEGDQIGQFRNTQIRYPFREIDHSFFYSLGTPKKPFLAFIHGSAQTGKTMLSVLVSLELISYFDSKVLFIVDGENLDSAIEYLSERTVSKNFVLQPAEYLKQIEEKLKNDDFEFLFIDSNASFKLNLANIKALRKEHPGLSIFCTLGRENEGMLNVADIVFRTDVRKVSLIDNIRNGYADVMLKEHPGEENGIMMFRNSDEDGFKMWLS